MKDYYHILNISSSATMDEVKKAFRKLALVYHPDKNSDSRIANAKFLEIREAYQILSDRKKRAQYNYKKYFHAYEQTGPPLASSIEDILQTSIELRKKVSAIDPFRIDRDQLFYEVSAILSDHNISILLTSNQTDVYKKIILNIVDSIQHLSFNYTREVIAKMQRTAVENALTQKELTRLLSQASLLHSWNRYKFLIALISALLLCIFIYMSGK